MWLVLFLEFCSLQTVNTLFAEFLHCFAKSNSLLLLVLSDVQMFWFSFQVLLNSGLCGHRLLGLLILLFNF